MKENVSLSLEITPSINKISNFVKLEISAKLEDFSGRELPQQVASLALGTFSRSVQTTVVVADADTVVLGGLVRDKQSNQVSKVPILGDIPLLEIGDGAVIGGHATVICHLFEKQGLVIKKVKIGKKVIIGLNSIIMPGAQIGDGAIIAAGAIVPKDTKIEAGSVYYGIK